MSIRLTLAAAVCAAVFIGLWAAGDSSAAGAKPLPDTPESKVSAFMRAKLAHSQNVLDGLVTEDFDKIKAGGQKMVIMSKATEWVVVEGPIYAQYSSEFRRAAQHLIKAAEEKNVDAAALAYVNLTLNCVNCHSFVRSSKVAAGEPVSDGLRLALQRAHE